MICFSNARISRAQSQNSAAACQGTHFDLWRTYEIVPSATNRWLLPASAAPRYGLRLVPGVGAPGVCLKISRDECTHQIDTPLSQRSLYTPKVGLRGLLDFQTIVRTNVSPGCRGFCNFIQNHFGFFSSSNGNGKRGCVFRFSILHSCGRRRRRASS